MITPERMTEIKRICACVPYIEAPHGVVETQTAIRQLIDEYEYLSKLVYPTPEPSQEADQ